MFSISYFKKVFCFNYELITALLLFFLQRTHFIQTVGEKLS